MSELEMRGARKEMGVLGVIAAFAGGALLGAITTLLLAPQSGAELRRRLAHRAERSKEALERVGQAAREAATTARTTFTAAMHEETPPRPAHPH